ncbi:retrovirus-related pol polyprotein from transposon TNT 1-94 [Tanacetum coccineum]
MLTKPRFFYDHKTKQALGLQNPFYLKKAQQLEPKLYVGNVIEKSNAIVIPDFEETLLLAEESRSKMILKQKDPIMLEKKVNTTPVNYVNSMNSPEPNLSSRPTKVIVPKELPKVIMMNTSLKKLKHHLTSLTWLLKKEPHPQLSLRARGEKFKENACPLTRITTTTKVPHRIPSALDNETPKPVVTLVYSWKPRKSKTNGSVSKSKVVQIVLWYLDSGFSMNMTGYRSQLTNFVNKFLGTVKFGNDHVAKILGYGDYQIGNVTISRVYYVEGLGHNLFSVGQFCDSNLEVAFRQHTCFIHNLEGVDLLTGSRGNNLYIMSFGDMMASSPICLLSKASKTKSWLWYRRLSHLNFGAINHLARHGLVRGLPKLKFKMDHMCSTCAMGKSKNKSHTPKSEETNQEKLYLLHMDLCGPMRVASVNGKKYILVIVDDLS